MAQSVEYSLLPIPDVIDMVTSLENLKLSMYYSVKTINETPTLLTIFRHNDNWMRYIIIVSPKMTPANPQPKISFIGVNYDSTLLQSYIQENAVLVPINIIRSQVSLYFRTQFYGFTYRVPNLDRLREIKQSLINIFVFPSETYVLYGSIVIHFTLIQNYYIVSYCGLLDTESLTVGSIHKWDWSDGLLSGKLDNQIAYVWNNSFFSLVNQYPNITYNRNVPQRVIVGGTSNYIINEPTSDEIISKGTFAHKLSIQSNEISGELIDYTSLRNFIVIDKYPYLYILSFSNVLPIVSKSTYITTVFPFYAMVGQASFIDTDTSLVTTAVKVSFVNVKDDTFQQSGDLFFKFIGDPVDLANCEIIVYRTTFAQFLTKESGRVILADLRPYVLETMMFDPIDNDNYTMEKGMALTELARPTSSHMTYVEPFSRFRQSNLSVAGGHDDGSAAGYFGRAAADSAGFMCASRGRAGGLASRGRAGGLASRGRAGGLATTGESAGYGASNGFEDGMASGHVDNSCHASASATSRRGYAAYAGYAGYAAGGSSARSGAHKKFTSLVRLNAR